MTTTASGLYTDVGVSYKSKKEGKDQESIQSSTTSDPGYEWESDNVTIRHHKREPRGPPLQYFSVSIFFDKKYMTFCKIIFSHVLLDFHRKWTALV